MYSKSTLYSLYVKTQERKMNMYLNLSLLKNCEINSMKLYKKVLIVIL